MAGVVRFALALLATVVCLPSVALFAADDDVDGYHMFTNKDGQAIEAKIVEVASDWKNMTIERRDGRSFAMVINVLSLDDQQIVKDWIKLHPVSAAVAKAELDVTFEKAENTVEREKDDYYRFTTKDVTYTITVRNKSRTDLVGAKLEYALLMTQGVKIYRDEISGKPETYSTSTDGEKLVEKANEDLPETLPYNYAHSLVTKPVKSERVQGDGNTVYGEDEVVGALALVFDRTGNLIGEFKSSESTMRDVTWEKNVGKVNRPNGESAPAASSVSPSDNSASTPASSPPATIVVDGIDVRMLDEMPEKLQKGDTLGSGMSPKIAGKPFVVSANVDLDESSPDGVIVAHGGGARGYAIYVHAGKLEFIAKRVNDSNRAIVRSVEISLAGLPTTEFELTAEFSADRMAILVNGQLRKTAESFGELIDRNPIAGMSVGYESEENPIVPLAANAPFAGSIRDLTVRLVP